MASGCCRERTGTVPGLLLAMLVALPGVASGSAAGILAGTSLLVPGVGQVFNGEIGKGLAHQAVFQASGALSSHYKEQDDFKSRDDRYDHDERIFAPSRSSELDFLSWQVEMNTRYYSAYDAYRKRRLAEGNAGYNTPMPADEGLQDLAMAPFQLRYVGRLTTLIPLAVLSSGLSKSDWRFDPVGNVTRGEVAMYSAARMEAVAVGEEAFYRGVLNNSFSHMWGPRWGLAASSLAFGAVHNGAGAAAGPVEATLMGAYFGWLHQRNDYRLGESVALHFWTKVFAEAGYLLASDDEDKQAMIRWEIRF